MKTTRARTGIGSFLVLAVLVAAATPASAQWRPERLAADGSELPRTPWGAPDLQGLWNNSTTTPLERLTAEEQAQGREAQRAVIEATRGTGAGWLEQAGEIERDALIVDPPDGRIRMTEQAVRRLIDRENARAGRGEADSWLDRNNWERCISRTLPTAMIPTVYNANYQILQTPDHFVLVMEMIHEARIVPLDGRPHASGARFGSGWATRAATGRATRWSSRRSTSTTASTAATTSPRTSPRPARAARARPCG